MPWVKRHPKDNPKDSRFDRISPYVWEHPSWRRYFKEIDSGKRDIGMKCWFKLADGSEIDGPAKLATRHKQIKPEHIAPLPQSRLTPAGGEYETIIGTAGFQDLAKARIAVKFAVQKQITCPMCQSVLDQHSAMLIDNQKGNMAVICGRCAKPFRASSIEPAVKAGASFELTTWHGIEKLPNAKRV